MVGGVSKVFRRLPVDVVPVAVHLCQILHTNKAKCDHLRPDRISNFVVLKNLRKIRLQLCDGFHLFGRSFAENVGHAHYRLGKVGGFKRSRRA